MAGGTKVIAQAAQVWGPFRVSYSGIGGNAIEVVDADVDFGVRVYSSKGSTIAGLYFGGLGSISFSHAFLSVVGVISGDTISAADSLNASKRVLLLQSSTPAFITANQNDWVPATPAPTNIRVSANAGRSITGLAGGANGQRITLHNVGSNAIILPHSSASSSFGNRFMCPNSAAFTLRVNAAVDMWYDIASSAWRLIAP